MTTEQKTDTDFVQQFKAAEQRAFATNKLQLVSDHPDCKIPIAKAVAHAAGLSLLKDKLNGPTVYLSAKFHQEMNAHIVFLNDKPNNKNDDNLCIWRATTGSLNFMDTAKSVVQTTACILTLLGYEVFIEDSQEVFSPIIQGTGKWASQNESVVA